MNRQRLIYLQTKLWQYNSELLLAAILVLALSLRLWGIDFGLPNLYHPDEDALIMPAVTIVKTGNLKPIWLNYGSVQIYILVAVVALVFLYFARNGTMSEVSQLAIFERGSYPAVYAHPEIYIAARSVTAVMGTGVVLLVYMLGRRLGSERLGLVAAALTAVLPGLVVDAHFATTDTPLTFMILLSLYLLLRAYDNWTVDSFWAYAGAGFVCGLATSTKYNGVVIALPLLLVALLRVHDLDKLLSFRVLSGSLAMILGFLAGTPFALLDIPHFLYWLGYSLNQYNLPNGLELPGSSLQWHLNYLITSPNAIVIVFGLPGLFLSLRHWGKRGMIVNSLALVMWLTVASQPRREQRMWLPTAPLFAMWTALSIEVLMLKLRRYPRTHRLKQAMALLPVLLVLPLLVASVGYNVRFQEADVRSLVKDWIEDKIPEGTTIAVDYFAPNVDTQRWPVVKTFRIYDRELSWYQEHGVEYLILSEAITDPTRLSTVQKASHDLLTQNACLVEVLRGPFIANPNFRMWVYEVPPCETRVEQKSLR